MPSDLTAAYRQVHPADPPTDPQAAVLVASLARDADDLALLLDALGIDRATQLRAAARMKLARLARPA